MIFETLHESAERGELMLVDGGLCHWHLRRDGQLTIREIISTRPGAGSLMLRRLEHVPGAASLFAKCPADLPANAWYARRGFHAQRLEITRNGRRLVCWSKALDNTTRQPNRGDLEVIYCADGNSRAAQIAIDAGMLYGARLPASVAFRPYFADQEWKQPDRAAYMVRLAEHRPHMATVLDLGHYDQLDEVLSWAQEAAQYVQRVIIIPKAHGIIERLPHTINGAKVRLGYSVPTRYGGTTVQLSEFQAWRGDGVHLLGGSPEKQMRLYTALGNVRSVDTNYPQKMAIQYGQYWTPVQTVGRVRHWPRLDEVDAAHGIDIPYEAFKRSCVNIMTAWRAVVASPREPARINHQLPLLAHDAVSA